MAINLQKGQRIEIGLSRITVGLGWDPNEGTGGTYDLDASAFMLDSSRKLPAEGYFVFYGNCASPDGALQHTGDDPTGGNSATGDDESIRMDLSKVAPNVQEILFVATIHEAAKKSQNFGQVRNSYIRIVDDISGQEIAKYELGEDFSIETAVEFGRLYLRDRQWKFEASRVGYKEDLAYFVENYFTGTVIR